MLTITCSRSGFLVSLHLATSQPSCGAFPSPHSTHTKSEDPNSRGLTMKKLVHSSLALLLRALALLALLLAATRPALAAAPAGLQIGNQASATYTDSSA